MANKYTYTDRVIPIWNSLSNYAVSAATVNTFKRRLDKLWSDQTDQETSYIIIKHIFMASETVVLQCNIL